MILNNTPTNEAILSNTEECGEFRIRNSAKAFQILSNGLYSNKIRAIIRELSCNAVDSHVAAGKSNVPFDVHLPNQIEPWFSIRDYGVGLDHDQIINIYTTYFESTKTLSNEFIGALGLGSKSPFSYTDNFTVTAIKDGYKGIYSAYLNQDGVPAITRMFNDETNEPNGVEVKFSVNNHYDFHKFSEEAKYVYTYFSLRPVISGVSNFKVVEVSYIDKNIIPGVHSTNSRSCTAVMGNIAYPVIMPNAETNLGPLRNLLSCGLELHFDIGELDFQASREGLSYIPSTIEAIKEKLTTLNNQLAAHLAENADKISNPWERALYLMDRQRFPLWSAAATKYVSDTRNPLIVNIPGDWNHFSAETLKFNVSDLESKYNIKISGFSKTNNSSTCNSLKPQTFHIPSSNETGIAWNFCVGKDTFFIKNNTKTGALERAKYHWKTSSNQSIKFSSTVYVLECSDKTKPALFDKFLADLYHPHQVMQASDLSEKVRAKSTLSNKNVSILKLGEKLSGSRWSRKIDFVWQDAGSVAALDASKTYYYLPLVGFKAISKAGVNFNAKTFMIDIKNCGVSSLNVDVYGVRKADLDFIKTQSNWVNIEEFVHDTLSKVDGQTLINMAIESLDYYDKMSYNKNIADLLDKDSPYAKAERKRNLATSVSFDMQSLNRLCGQYKTVINWNQIKESIIEENKHIKERYPLLTSLNIWKNEKEIAEYINLIDEKKGV